MLLLRKELMRTINKIGIFERMLHAWNDRSFVSLAAYVSLMMMMMMG
jgi:hypothetical protein